MTDQFSPGSQSATGSDYEILLQGMLDASWSEYFSGWTVEIHSDGVTRLVGHAVDQAALHGVLRKLRDLGLVLISLRQL